MKTTHNPGQGGLSAFVCFMGLLCLPVFAQSQTPIITVRLANPQYHCMTGEYCLDVEFKSNTLDQQVFGMNVRFFYPDTLLELVGFSDFQGGYGPVFPDPPMVMNSQFAGPVLFNFAGSADFVNGAMQLLDNVPPPIILDTMNWTKLFQICFTIDDPNPDIQSFCPSVVWDLQEDPANGGYLIGDDGVVITLVDPTMMMASIPSDENVVQFNWMYTDPVMPPYGTPIEEVCTSLDCSPMIVCAVDTTIECDESTLPATTGFATATDICEGDPTITYSDMSMSGNCPNNLTITRTWIATNDCMLSDTCYQLITVIDTTPPMLLCPSDMTVQCANLVPAPNPALVGTTDNCSGAGTVTFVGDMMSNQSCSNRFTITRTYRATDVCGNSATCNQTITVFDNTAPSITCLPNVTVQCTGQVPMPNPGGVGTTDNCGGAATVTFVSDVTNNVTCINRYSIARTYRATDACGNSTTCIQSIVVNDQTAPMITCPSDMTVACADLIPPINPATVSATDNCAGGSTLSHVSDVTVGQTCANRYTIMRTYMAKDACWNSATCTQVITVNDQTPPTITCPQNLTVSCANMVPSPSVGGVMSSDNCGGGATVTHVGDDISNQTCANRYTVTRTYRATDACGNSTTCTQTITVNDQTPPSITCPMNVTIDDMDSSDPQNTGTPSISDNCGETPGLIHADVIIPGICDQRYTIQRTWTATDACGNSATCLQIVQVAGGCIVDLSLLKILNAGQSIVSGGDDVNFTITVHNDGVVAVSSIKVIDYIPLGFSLNDPDWVAGTAGSTGQSATTILSIMNGALGVGGLMPGQSVPVEITLMADPNITTGVYINQAEIDKVFDLGGNDVSANDSDSVPDEDDTNDGMNEDDHDNAQICVLTPPIILGEKFICSGDTVTYSVQDYNPENTYDWSLQNGGTIIENTGQTITIYWHPTPGGPYIISLTVTVAPGCQITGTLNVLGQNEGALACFDHINLSIDNECGTLLLSGLVLTGDQSGNDNYEVIIKDMDGNIIPDATFTWQDVGKTFKVAILSRCSGQSCWGFVTVEDKLPPVIDCICPPNNEDRLCNITCRQIEQIVAGNIPEELRPEVVDNCGGTTLDIININVDYGNCGGGKVQVTWKATDNSNNMSTCLQEYHIVPLTLETLKFPPDYYGTCSGSSDPAVTGWPQVDGIELNLPAGLCNLYVTYKDLVIKLCGNGTKIIRTWTVIDWCTGQTSVFSQAIYHADHEGPVLTCMENLEVGTDQWYCYANVVVPKPIATDACSKIASYKLFSPDGTVVNVGNNFVVNGLTQGTHTVKWVVTDECENSSSCNIQITVVDDVPPVVSCHRHTVVSLTDERPHGVTLVPAAAFNDGSTDNCGPLSFRVRRMDSCIDFDWTTDGACVDDVPGGIPPVNAKDRGTDRGPCVPFSCCDVGSGYIMVELEVTDASGNANYCMVEVEVQDKLKPIVECPPTIVVSCEYLFNVIEGTFYDGEGNNNGSLDEDPLSAIFGDVYDASRHQQSERKDISILDPDNTQYPQLHIWGKDGWATDNCEVDLQVTVSKTDDCSGATFPVQGPPGAVSLIERRFIANDGYNVGSCLQRIWVVNFHPFFITDEDCYNSNPNDGVIWPCDELLTTCPQTLDGLSEPVIFDDGCSLIGMNHVDTRYDFVDNACYKVLREWRIIDWCQYNPNTGYGLWSYVQTLRVMDAVMPEFLDCPSGPLELCVADPGIRIPANNQIFLGENNPNSTSCSAHVTMSQNVHETCSDIVIYDVKIYPFNGNSFIQIVPTTTVTLDGNHDGVLSFDTEQSSIPSVQHNGLPYNSPMCGDYHRVLWSMEDGCGNRSYCDYLFRLEDCKKPVPVCIEGLSVMIGLDGEVSVWAKDFNASSSDDCTPAADLLYSFSGTSYQPSFTYNCDNVSEFGVELPVEMWVADGGSDQNCNGVIEWSERNKDLCTTTIVITDQNGVCEQEQGMLAGEILTDHSDAVEKVIVNISNPQQVFPSYTTSGDGKFVFSTLPVGLDYMISAERNDDYKNGVTTLDLVKIQKHLLGTELFTSPYQYIAADANNSHTVTALDLLDIRKLILGIYTVLPNNDSWRFIDKKYVMPDPANPWQFDENVFVNHWHGQSMNNDFVAVKIGDVNNTVKANAFQLENREERRVMNIRLDSKAEAKAGEIVEMKLTFPEIVSGFQWTMETDGMEYVGVTSGDIQIDDSNVGLLENGVTTMSWNGEVLSDGHPKTEMNIILRWKITSPGKVSNRIRLTSLVTPAESYTPTGEILQVKLISTDNESSKEFTLYQNKPNPWNGQTTIGFDLPEDGHARLMIYDVTGKAITSQEGDFKAGYNTFLLTARDVPSTGVMYYRLECGGYSASKKMVLIR